MVFKAIGLREFVLVNGAGKFSCHISGREIHETLKPRQLGYEIDHIFGANNIDEIAPFPINRKVVNSGKMKKVPDT